MSAAEVDISKDGRVDNAMTYRMCRLLLLEGSAYDKGVRYHTIGQRDRGVPDGRVRSEYDPVRGMERNLNVLANRYAQFAGSAVFLRG